MSSKQLLWKVISCLLLLRQRKIRNKQTNKKEKHSNHSNRNMQIRLWWLRGFKLDFVINVNYQIILDSFFSNLKNVSVYEKFPPIFRGKNSVDTFITVERNFFVEQSLVSLIFFTARDNNLELISAQKNVSFETFLFPQAALKQKAITASLFRFQEILRERRPFRGYCTKERNKYWLCNIRKGPSAQFCFDEKYFQLAATFRFRLLFLLPV